MDSGIIILGDLKKDIEYIEYYSKIEEAQLKKIYSGFNELGKYYNSPNQSLLNEKQLGFNNDISLITSKRNIYVMILNKTIYTYLQMAKKVENDYSKDVYEI